MSSVSQPIAIIPARGNSKRLSRKNILPWKGMPLVVHSINNALATNLFSEVIVSSEDDEILEISKKNRAKPIKRQISLSEDSSTVAEVCMSVLLKYPDIKHFCCIYPTAVKLAPKIITESFATFEKTENCDFLMGVSLYNYPPQQALIQNENNNLILLNPEFENIQSQFYKECFVSNGTFYWAKKSVFLEQKNFYGKNLKPFVLDESQVSDINTPKDYEILLKSQK